MPSTDWGRLGFVLGSSHRKALVRTLVERPKTPKEISLRTGIAISHVSNTLRELEAEKIVICLTPELRKGRLFGLTEIGKQLAARIELG